MRTLSADEARAVLLGAAALGTWLGAGQSGVVALLDTLGAVQLDPIDRIGTNADLVAFARVNGLKRGDVHRYARGVSFEHFAKERCLVHARHFAHYRGQAVETPWWRHSERMKRIPASVLHAARVDGTVERLLEAGRLVTVRVGRRPYLMLPEPAAPLPDDGAVRILGPLDALVWDRALVRDAFGFDYVWEIYKPEPQRVWGYYVCPVLADGRLVGRLEGRREGRTLVVQRLWGAIEVDRLNAALERLAAANGCDAVATLPPRSALPEMAGTGPETTKDTSRAPRR